MKNKLIILGLTLAILFGGFSVARAMTQGELDTICLAFGCTTQQKAILQVLVSTPAPQAYLFTKDLSVGMNSEDVRQLQIFLNKTSATQIAVSPLYGSPGHESIYFGVKTQIALAHFQSLHNLSATGYLDLATRTVINQIINGTPSSGGGTSTMLTASTGNATSVTSTTATVSGSYTGSGATSVYFKYGTTTSLGSTLAATLGNSFSATLTGLTASTAYYVQACATDTASNTSCGVTLSFTTTATQSGSSSVVTNYAGISGTSATLYGTYSISGSGTSWFEWGTTSSLVSSGSGSAVGVTSQSNTSGSMSYTLSNLSAGTTYYYRSVLQPTGGSVLYGQVVGFTTTANNNNGGGGNNTYYPPSVTTNVATSIGSTTAIIGATANGNGAATSVYFVYGTSSSALTSSTTPDAIGTGSATTSQTLSGLSAGTTYYFQAIGINTAGTVPGSVLSFTTTSSGGSGGLTVTTGTPSSITTTGATLNGTFSGSGVTSVLFQYGTTSSLGSILTASVTTSFSASLSGLATGTTYYVQACASNGTMSCGSIVSFSTTGSGASLPTVTTTSPSDITATQASLNGTFTTGGVTTSTWFEYGTSATLSGAAATTPVSQNANGAMSAALSNLTQGTTYYYRANASNSAGTVHGSILSFATNSQSGSAPTVTTNNATSVTASGATFSSTITTGGLATSTWFEYATNASLTSPSSTQQVSQASGTTSVTYTLSSGLVPNTLYYYRAAAFNALGSVNGQILSFTTLNGSMPTATTTSATNITTTGATLNANITTGGLALNSSYFLYTLLGGYLNCSNVPSYTNNTPNVGLPNGTTTMPVAISGLTTHTSYCFKPYVHNTVGGSYGSPMLLVTN